MNGIKGYISIREAPYRWGVSERRVKTDEITLENDMQLAKVMQIKCTNHTISHGHQAFSGNFCIVLVPCVVHFDAIMQI